jgi:hypothetical protein
VLWFLYLLADTTRIKCTTRTGRPENSNVFDELFYCPIRRKNK